MVKVVEIGDSERRPKYFKTCCSWCKSTLVFEFGDAWIVDPKNPQGRIECPVCRTKTFFTFWADREKQYLSAATPIEYDEYENAYSDTSKRGLEILREERAKEL